MRKNRLKAKKLPIFKQHITQRLKQHLGHYFYANIQR